MTHDEANDKAAADLLKAAHRAVNMARIPGLYLAAASNALPSAATTTEPQSAVVECRGPEHRPGTDLLRAPAAEAQELPFVLGAYPAERVD